MVSKVKLDLVEGGGISRCGEEAVLSLELAAEGWVLVGLPVWAGKRH